MSEKEEKKGGQEEEGRRDKIGNEAGPTTALALASCLVRIESDSTSHKEKDLAIAFLLMLSQQHQFRTSQ